MTAQTAGEPTDKGGLAPSEILASVRSAGFDPRSRPLQRGSVYFVFAVDRHFMDVRVTVDANSGRVLSSTRLAGVRYGGPGYDGHEVLSRVYERPPVPPGDIPNRGGARNNAPAATSAAVRPPLPRNRPGETLADPVTEAPPQVPPRVAPPPAGFGDTTAEASPSPPRSTTPSPVAAPPPAPSRPQQPVMVPIAPLE